MSAPNSPNRCTTTNFHANASLGGPAAHDFVPSNIAKMTRADRAMFTASTALYPDEMVEHANSLGDMLAKRSKARAHSPPAPGNAAAAPAPKCSTSTTPCSTAGSGSTTSSTHPRRCPRRRLGPRTLRRRQRIRAPHY